MEVPWSMAMNLRLTPEQDATLTELARAEGVSKQEAVVRAIHEAASRRMHRADVAAGSAWGRERYADVLRRLGE